MEFILLAVIVLQFIYQIYSDIQNRKERKFLQMNLEDFTDFDESTPEDGKNEENPYISMDEVGIEDLLKTKEKR